LRGDMPLPNDAVARPSAGSPLASRWGKGPRPGACGLSGTSSSRHDWSSPSNLPAESASALDRVRAIRSRRSGLPRSTHGVRAGTRLEKKRSGSGSQCELHPSLEPRAPTLDRGYFAAANIVAAGAPTQTRALHRSMHSLLRT
jgi:hypothetical protein